ncbi:hypothetical protein [Cupriavidus plantarum]|uniref:hypothetical protein n=1 Tax=Cupriavidus plantarum TaxID=942865 RepID=UPI001B24D343|nr:hypothetical protein [Cupriavidus plantarum]CAG2151184.1 hypothetical protein LMG26296_04907 [Cupriavidus plantarum]SMR65891.1 hypothetical protein SAMN05421735_0756 [Cupriavidus plantarum]
MKELESFEVVYHGPALDSPEADNTHLIPALAAIADLFTEVTTATNGRRIGLRVATEARPNVGAFHMVFTLSRAPRLPRHYTYASASSALAMPSVLAQLSLPKMSLIWFIRTLRGRAPCKVVDCGTYYNVGITDTECVDVGARTLRLWCNPRVRTSLETALSPLHREGINTFSMLRDGNPWLTIHKHELDHFKADPHGEFDL